MYMLDTNILIYLIKQKPVAVLTHFQQHDFAEICVSSITVAELEYGIAKSGSPQKNKQTLDGWLQLLQRPSFDENAASAYGTLRATLEARGTPIGPLDTLIAAHALSLQATLVTNNVREFSRVPGLTIKDWTIH